MTEPAPAPGPRAATRQPRGSPLAARRGELHGLGLTAPDCPSDGRSGPKRSVTLGSELFALAIAGPLRSVTAGPRRGLGQIGPLRSIGCLRFDRFVRFGSTRGSRAISIASSARHTTSSGRNCTRSCCAATRAMPSASIGPSSSPGTSPTTSTGGRASSSPAGAPTEPSTRTCTPGSMSTNRHI